MFPWLAVLAILLEEESDDEKRQLILMQRSRRRYARIRRKLNPLRDMSDIKFMKKFRYKKDFVRWLCAELKPHLTVFHGVKSAIPVHLQVLCFLRLLVVGFHQKTKVGESMGMSKATVRRVFTRVQRSIENYTF